MKVLRGQTLLSPAGMLRSFLIVSVVCLVVAALVLVILAPDPIAGDRAVPIAYLMALIFATTTAMAAAKDRGPGRVFWALVAAGLILRFVGDAGWGDLGTFEGTTTAFTGYDAAYLASDLSFFAALLWLVTKTIKRITLVSAMDTMSVMFSVGMLAWYFAIGPAIDDSLGLDQPHRAIMTLSGFACAAAYLSLSLIAGSGARRPSFVAFLMLAFLTFLVAEGLFIRLRSVGLYAPGGWPDLVWALGFIFLGVGALKSIPPAGFTPQPEVGSPRVFFFWLGPLSPAVQISFLLLWGAAHPPLPAYALLGAAVIVTYLALRISLMARITKELRIEREKVAVKEEQSRILRELHDTAKQSMRGTTMLIEACLQAQAKEKDPALVKSLLQRTFEISSDAERQLSDSLGLETFGTSNAVAPTDFFAERFAKFGEDFGMETHVELRAPLETLKRDETMVAHRVCVEAAWNAVKHSKAHSLRLSSERAGPVLTLRVQDDGRGFRPEEATEGLGLRFMRSRAEEVGAELDVRSDPGEGTTVELRFEE